MIRYFDNAPDVPFNSIVVYNDGVPSTRVTAPRRACYKPEFICDTPEEAERMRLLIEQRREEREALDRKWERRLAEEVTR